MADSAIGSLDRRTDRVRNGALSELGGMVPHTSDGDLHVSADGETRSRVRAMRKGGAACLVEDLSRRLRDEPCPVMNPSHPLAMVLS